MKLNRAREHIDASMTESPICGNQSESAEFQTSSIWQFLEVNLVDGSFRIIDRSNESSYTVKGLISQQNQLVITKDHTAQDREFLEIFSNPVKETSTLNLHADYNNRHLYAKKTYECGTTKGHEKMTRNRFKIRCSTSLSSQINNVFSENVGCTENVIDLETNIMTANLGLSKDDNFYTSKLISTGQTVVNNELTTFRDTTRVGKLTRKSTESTFSSSFENDSLGSSVEYDSNKNTDKNIFLRACREGKLKMLKETMENGVSPFVFDKNGMSGLHRAVKYGNCEIVNYLLENAPKELIELCEYKYNRTALHLAAVYRRRAICQMLVKAGAMVVCKDKTGASPRKLAIEAGDTMIALLLQKAELMYCIQSAAEMAFV